MKTEKANDTETNIASDGQSADSPPAGFISKRELARRLRKSIRTISYWQRCGILPYVKCRRSVYYDWHAITAHLGRNFHVCRKPDP